MQHTQPAQVKGRNPLDVEMNVARTRISVLGFALALCLFASSTLLSIGQAYKISAVWAFLPSFVSLSLGFSLTLVALLLFVGSLRLGQGGNAQIWPFSFGEICMYLALSQVLAGGFQYLATGILFVFHNFPQDTQLAPEQVQQLLPAAGKLSTWLTLCTGLGWVASIYIAPGYFLMRNPLPWNRKWIVAAVYLVLLLNIFWISAIPYQMHARAAGRPDDLAPHFAEQFVQPFLWANRPTTFGAHSEQP